MPTAPIHQASERSPRSNRARHVMGYVVDLAILTLGLVAMRYLAVHLWRLPDGDVDEYHRYALAFWTSHPLFHALPVEYPPLAIIAFTLTLLPPANNYHLVFAGCMGAFVLIGYLGFRRYAGRRQALLFGIYLLIGTSGVLMGRFDLVPALVTLAALWAAQQRRYRLAYALLAIGILLKLYPIFLLPIVSIEQWRAATVADATGDWNRNIRQRIRRVLAQPATFRVARDAGICIVIVGLGFVGAYLLSPAGTISAFQYLSARPLQQESTPASILWVGTFFHFPAHGDYSFLSHNYVGPLDVALKPLSSCALVFGCLWVYWRQMQGKLTFVRACVACLCVVIATNKIFSPQYLIWVIPFVAASGEFDLAWVAICLLTTLDFPIIYQERHFWILANDWRFMLVVAVRNALLVYVALRTTLRTYAQDRESVGAAQPFVKRLIRLANG